MVRKIIKTPNDTLREKSSSVDNISNPETQALIHDLKETIKADQNAAGLAAPQINENKQIFVYKDPKERVQEYINPEITHRGNKKSLGQEACLSVPDKAGLVTRPKKVIIKAYDADGNKFKKTKKGFPARVIQHEYDHLEGVLFIDKAEKIIDTSEEAQK